MAINPDLQKERRSCTFNPDDLTHILDGGDYITERRRKIEGLALQEKIFTEGPDYVFLSRPEKYDRGIKKAMHYIKKIKELDLMNQADSYWYRNSESGKSSGSNPERSQDAYFNPGDAFYSMVFPNEVAPIDLHLGMFVPAIRGMTSKEQLTKWMPRAESFSIIGTYAQTEMGHGFQNRPVLDFRNRKWPLSRKRYAFPNENPPISLHTGMFVPTLVNQATPEQRNKWLPLAEKYDVIGTYAQTEMGHGTHPETFNKKQGRTQKWEKTPLVFPNENPPIGLHNAMFIPALNSQCTKEQANIWLPKANNFEIMGTYAQTEMGHGTHLRGVETTATYDPSTEEFIINSPTLTSLKWWPGGLGKTSNYVVLMATLYTKGQHCGLQPFIVQIRDEETHEPLPGIIVGDIGPKLAYDMIDNGFLGFKNVRIPRDRMLMKNAEVKKDGTFISAKNSKLSYGTMVFVRSMIVMDVSARGLAQALTIAIRYSCVRRQSELKPGAPEPQVIEYQTQQYKLLPLLATAYAFWFAGKEMRDIYFSINYEIQQGNTEALPELHALSSALKAFTTDITMFGIETCRLACGGHGYSMASGFPKIYGNCTPACTYEGENTVLYMQTARFLLKAYSAARSGQPVSRLMSYLKEARGARSRFDKSMNLQGLVTDFKHRASRLVNKAGDKYSKLLASGHPDWEARNLCSVDLVNAAKAHSLQWIVDNYVQYLGKKEGTEEVRRVLTTLCQMYAVYCITQYAGDFLEDNYMSASQIATAENCVLDLLQEIRPNAVGLVDSFDFRDELLCSVLGRYDGNVYENLYKWAQNAPLNRKQVDDSFYKYIKPYREELKSKI